MQGGCYGKQQAVSVLLLIAELSEHHQDVPHADLRIGIQHVTRGKQLCTAREGCCLALVSRILKNVVKNLDARTSLYGFFRK